VSPLVIGFDVATEGLGEESKAWLGREVTAYTASGQVCTGRVARFEVRVQAVPHFGMRQGWNGAEGAAKASTEQIAKTIQGMAQSEEHFLVGVLDRACSGTWASRTPHAFSPATPVKGALREAAVAAFKALPGYAELQKRFVKESGDAKQAWETVNGELSVVEVRAKARPALVLVTARGGVGCSGFNGSLSAFWEVGGASTDTAKLGPVKATFPEVVSLRGALEHPEGAALLAGPDGYNDEVAVVRLSAPKPLRRVLLATSFWDCDC
jgi:hypothetical protein